MYSLVRPAPPLDSIAMIEAIHPLVWWTRKAMVIQLARSITWGLVDEAGELVFVLGLAPLPPERPGELLMEVWMQIRRARPDVLHAVRHHARLTLAKVCQTGDRVRIRAVIKAGHRPGRRIARLLDLKPADADDSTETWEWASS